MEQLRPTPAARHSFPATFIHRDLKDSTHIFLRYDAISRALDPLYNGPHKVIARTDKTFNIVVGKTSRQQTESSLHTFCTGPGPTSLPTPAAHQLKPTALQPQQSHKTRAPPTTESGRNVCFAARLNTSVVFSAGGHVGCSHMSKNSFFHATTSTYPTVIQNYIKPKFMIQALFTP